MVFSLDRWLTQQSGPGLVLAILVVSLVATLVFLEYAFDWPVHLRTEDRTPAPAPAHR